MTAYLPALKSFPQKARLFFARKEAVTCIPRPQVALWNAQCRLQEPRHLHRVYFRRRGQQSGLDPKVSRHKSVSGCLGRRCDRSRLTQRSPAGGTGHVLFWRRSTTGAVETTQVLDPSRLGTTWGMMPPTSTLVGWGAFGSSSSSSWGAFGTGDNNAGGEGSLG